MRIAKSIERVIGTFDVAPLRTPTSEAQDPLVMRTVASGTILDMWMVEWAATGSSVQFNWPAVLSFNPTSTTLALWTSNIDQTPCLEALMQIRELETVPCSTGPREPVIYVSFLEVAPWNKSGHPRRRLVGIGAFMLQAACVWSVKRGLEGAIGLHALPAAIGFYERLGFVAAPCPNEHHEPYYEMDSGTARRFLSSGGLE